MSTALGLILSFGCYQVAQAQSSNSDVLLDDVVVTATKTATKLSNIPASVTVITAKDIEEQGVSSVTELLRRTPGVNFNSSGGMGSYTRVQMRGLDEQHTLVLIDGVRQNNPSDSARAFDFEHMMVHNIERIEIVRGPQATLYGSNASGGVINIITKRGAQEGYKGSVNAEYGSYATRRLDADISYGGKIGDMPFRLGYAHSTYAANGPSVASEKSNVPPGLQTPSEDDRRTIFNHSLNAEISPSEDLRGRFFVTYTDLSTDNDRSLTGANNRVAVDADRHKDKKQYTYGTSWDLDTFDDKLLHKFQLSATNSRTDRFYHDTASYKPYNGHYASYYGDTVQADYSATYVINDNHKVTSGVIWDGERYKKVNKSWSQVSDKKQYHTGVMVQLQSDFLDDALNLTLGASYDMFSAIEGKATYRGGVGYTVPQTDTLIKASVGTGYTAPSLSRLYTYDNPSKLKPEESLLMDFGVEQPFFDRRLTVAATVFKNKLENQIVYQDDATICTGSTSKCYINRDEMNSKGVEAEINALAYQGETDSLELGTTYTYTLAMDETGAEIDRVPRHNLGLNATYRFDNEKGLFRVDSQYNGRRTDYYSFGAGKTRIRDGGEWKVDFLAEYEVYDDVRAYVRGENIFDANFTTSTGYTGTPQGFYVGVGYSF